MSRNFARLVALALVETPLTPAQLQLSCAHVSAPVWAYFCDVTTVLRTHRCVVGGPSPEAMDDVILLARFAAIRRGRLFLVPEDIASACTAVLPQRIKVRVGELQALATHLAGSLPQQRPAPGHDVVHPPALEMAVTALSFARMVVLDAVRSVPACI